MDNSKVTTPKTFCFVLMPFSSEFDDIYQIGIKEACDKAGAYCERVDEQIYGEKILDRVYNQISKADIVIADMTGRNPNVFYEVGYAHALGKLTILLTQDSDDIPFDLKPFPHIVYEKKVAFLRDELEKRVKYFIDNPPTKESEIKLGLELYLDNKNLATNKVEIKFPYDREPVFNLVVFNASTNTYKSGDFRIGILSGMFSRSRPQSIATTNLPDGKFLHMLPAFPTLFPDVYTSYAFTMHEHRNIKYSLGKVETVTAKLFTESGSQEFPILITAKV